MKMLVQRYLLSLELKCRNILFAKLIFSYPLQLRKYVYMLLEKYYLNQE